MNDLMAANRAFLVTGPFLRSVSMCCKNARTMDGINLFQVKLRWVLAEASSGILEQQTEGVRIRIAGMLARTAINGEALAAGTR
jgi:hypothetical protein